MRSVIDPILEEMSGWFGKLYSDTGHPSIPPEQLWRALPAQILYTIRSERLLVEQWDYNLLLRGLVGMSMDDERAGQGSELVLYGPRDDR